MGLSSPYRKYGCGNRPSSRALATEVTPLSPILRSKMGVDGSLPLLYGRSAAPPLRRLPSCAASFRCEMAGAAAQNGRAAQADANRD